MSQPNLIPIHRFTKKDIPFEIVKLDEAMAEDYDARAPHRHNYYEIFIFYKGGGTHKIDFHDYEIETNALHFISPGQVHLVKRAKGCKGYVITFHEELYALHDQHKNFLQQITLYHNYKDPALFTCSEEEMFVFQRLIDRIEQEYVSEGIMREELMRSYLNIFLIHSTRIFQQKNHGKKKEKYSQSGNYILQKFRQLLDEHYVKKQTVNEYAEEMAITPGHLNDVIKKMTGATASSHISERIILEAKRLLLNTNHSIKEISFLLGFDDPTYFGRFFRKSTSFTPGDFREHIRKKYHE
jgi:AraC family transcriptional activator of pobA